MRLVPRFVLIARERRRDRRRPALIDAALRVDVDAICPDCLTWIGPTDHVRRNAFGILEHDACPPLGAAQPNR